MDAERLNQLFAKVLKEELREDENSRKQSLEQFRDWILKNPDIRDCNTEDNFLLPFLRARKHSVPSAQEAVVKLIEMLHRFPFLRYNIDIDDPDINDVVSSGTQFSSPFRDKNGEVVSFYFPRNLDLKKHNYETAVRTIVLNIHTLVFNEINQVLGITYVLDYGDVSPAFFTMFPIGVIKLLEPLQSSPTRVKAIHVINLPPVANWFIKLVMSLLSEKMRNRFKFHNSMEELRKHIDPNILPKEYGGTMPMEEMIGLWKKEMAAHREYITAVNNVKLVGDSYKNEQGCDDESGIPNLPGSFRKLDVD